MDRRIKRIAIAATTAAIILACQTSYAQEMVSDGTASGFAMTASATDAGVVGCDACGSSWAEGNQGEGGLKSRFNHLCNYHRRVYRRNRVWPKPFNCADRQLYFAVWEPMFEDGFRCNCVFTDNHFDAKTNELNDAGKAKIAGIYRNAPKDHKLALVQNYGDPGVVDQRLRNLESAINTWYGSGSFSEIALTDKFLPTFAAERVQILNQLSGQQTPPPIIPVASGTGSTSDVAVGN